MRHEAARTAGDEDRQPRATSAGRAARAANTTDVQMCSKKDCKKGNTREKHEK
jgi:hypothetical protein